VVSGSMDWHLKLGCPKHEAVPPTWLQCLILQEQLLISVFLGCVALSYIVVFKVGKYRRIRWYRHRKGDTKTRQRTVIGKSPGQWRLRFVSNGSVPSGSNTVETSRTATR
jgi:hypothetical protein